MDYASRLTLAFKDTVYHFGLTQAQGVALDAWKNSQSEISNDDLLTQLVKLDVHLDCPVGPAFSKILPHGAHLAIYYSEGINRRDEGPSFVETDLDGTLTEIYSEDHVFNRIDGPAYVQTRPDGSSTEKFYKNDVVQAEIIQNADGSRVERNYTHGRKVRECCTAASFTPALV